MPLPDVLRSTLSTRLCHPAARLMLGSIVVASCLVIGHGARGRDRATTPARPIAQKAPTQRSFQLALPPVEPLTFQKFAPATAVAINAATPFVAAPNPAAKAFKFRGSAAEEEKAITCLAAAGWYEAGDDATGEQAVMQVVLNRLRHPAFPKNVCGVVFQGAERTAGCQFTFACDGAMERRPSPAAWARARLLARIALHGFVDGTVGWATHYHTEAVVPYWSAALDKNAKVGTHIFFRWQGTWGTPRAFVGGYRGTEQLDPRLAGYTAAKLAVSASPLAMDLGEGLSLGGRSVPAPLVPPTTPAPRSTTAAVAAMPHAADIVARADPAVATPRTSGE